MRKGRNKLMENVRSKYIKTKYIINRIRYWNLIDFNLVLNTLYRLRNINEIEKWNPSDWKISLMSTIPQKKYSFYDIFTDSSSSLVHTFTTNSLHDLVFSQKKNMHKGRFTLFSTFSKWCSDDLLFFPSSTKQDKKH